MRELLKINNIDYLIDYNANINKIKYLLIKSDNDALLDYDIFNDHYNIINSKELSKIIDLKDINYDSEIFKFINKNYIFNKISTITYNNSETHVINLCLINDKVFEIAHCEYINNIETYVMYTIDGFVFKYRCFLDNKMLSAINGSVIPVISKLT